MPLRIGIRKIVRLVCGICFRIFGSCTDIACRKTEFCTNAYYRKGNWEPETCFVGLSMWIKVYYNRSESPAVDMPFMDFLADVECSPMGAVIIRQDKGDDGIQLCMLRTRREDKIWFNRSYELKIDYTEEFYSAFAVKPRYKEKKSSLKLPTKAAATITSWRRNRYDQQGTDPKRCFPSGAGPCSGGSWVHAELRHICESICKFTELSGNERRNQSI